MNLKASSGDQLNKIYFLFLLIKLKNNVYYPKNAWIDKLK